MFVYLCDQLCFFRTQWDQIEKFQCLTQYGNRESLQFAMVVEVSQVLLSEIRLC